MARPAKKAMSAAELKCHCGRADKAWATKSATKWLYDEAYQFAIPFRRPAKWNQGSRVDNLFDETAIASTFHGAGTLKEDLFPSGQPFFKLETSAIGKAAARANGLDPVDVDRNLGNITDQVIPFFQTGEFDQSTTEMCIDLYAGTGILIPMRGDDANPVRYVTPPMDECALEPGAFGDTVFLSWRTKLTRRAIKAQWPKGVYSKDFEDQLAGDGADREVDICQDFWQDGKVWRFAAYLKEGAADNDNLPIVTESYRTKPFAAPRYHRVPGETEGRGPILLAMPAIKTVNKAQELTLKSSAIQMLGIWAYRPGGTFNPDTARIAPGAWWAMSSTGGVMGPDVTRMDTGTGNVQIGQLISQDLRQRIQVILNDDRLPDKSGSTPISASEVVARMARVKANYIGAFGRLINEIIPVIVPRVMEILYDAMLLQTDLKPDQLFVQIKVTSPMAAAMRINHLQPLMQILQLIEALQMDPNRFFKIDDLIDQIIADLNIEAKFRRNKAERAQVDKANADAKAQQAVTDALTKKPEIVANALQQQAA